MSIKEIEARLAAIAEEIKTRGAAMTAEEITSLENEVTDLKEKRASLLETAEKRAALLNSIADGSTQGVVVRSLPVEFPAEPLKPETTDPFDTQEYRKAFMEFVCRGTAIPAEYRANELTTTGDTGAVIPTTILNEIIAKAESYGNIYAKIRKLNVQGGVSVPILDLKPTAKWIGETTPSEDQKLSAKTSVIFNYYGLECKMAQSLLVNVVTLAEFQRQFVPLATEALIKAIEIGVFNGTGSASMMGVLNDTRIPAANKVTLSSTEFQSWTDWKKKVFAKMKKSYRNGCFVMAQGTFDGYIDGMVDSNGQPIGRVNYGIDGEEKYRFGGKVIETVEDDVIAPYDDAADGDAVAVFIKLDDYAINTNLQMRIVKWTDEDTNKIKNKCIMIIDGKILDPNSVIIIKKGA